MAGFIDELSLSEIVQRPLEQKAGCYNNRAQLPSPRIRLIHNTTKMELARLIPAVCSGIAGTCPRQSGLVRELFDSCRNWGQIRGPGVGFVSIGGVELLRAIHPPGNQFSVILWRTRGLCYKRYLRVYLFTLLPETHEVTLQGSIG